MTILRRDSFALIPKRCDKCNRLFWLEQYNVFYKTVGIREESLKCVVCEKCIKKSEGNE